MRYRGKIEYAQTRKMRERNTPLYRLAHWPIWIWVFFLAPGPLTFTLFAHGFGRGNLAWLGVVLAGTGAAGRWGGLARAGGGARELWVGGGADEGQCRQAIVTSVADAWWG